MAGQGDACDRGEFIAALSAVAIPVRGGDGIGRAVIAVHVPVARLALADLVAQAPALQAAAARVRALR